MVAAQFQQWKVGYSTRHGRCQCWDSEGWCWTTGETISSSHVQSWATTSGATPIQAWHRHQPGQVSGEGGMERILQTDPPQQRGVQALPQVPPQKLGKH
eukprot:6229373-Pyramimonas_sp.AAC.1